MKNKWYRAGVFVFFFLILVLTACHAQRRVEQISGGKKRVALVAKSAESAPFWNRTGGGECGEYRIQHGPDL